jgi:hypothetical protein
VLWGRFGEEGCSIGWWGLGGLGVCEAVMLEGGCGFNDSGEGLQRW